MANWEKLIAAEKDRIEWILATKNEVKLRELAWDDFRRTAQVVDDNPEAPFIVWPAINREPYQVWLPILLMQVVRLKIKGWLHGGEEVAVLGVPSSGSWYGEVLKRVGVLEKDGWRVSYPRIDKLKNLGEKPEGGWEILVPSYVHSCKSDGSRGKEGMVVFEPNELKGKIVIALDDAIAEGLTLSYLGEGLKKDLKVKQLIVAGAMAKEMQGGRERLSHNSAIDKVVSLVEITKEVLDDLNR